MTLLRWWVLTLPSLVLLRGVAKTLLMITVVLNKLAKVLLNELVKILQIMLVMLLMNKLAKLLRVLLVAAETLISGTRVLTSMTKLKQLV